jgi:hypothetical protein
MGAVVKNPITQLAQASVPGPTPAVSLDKSHIIKGRPFFQIVTKR